MDSTGGIRMTTKIKPRPEWTNARRIVVKIGSALLVDRATGRMRSTWLNSLADDVTALADAGKQVVLVSSGAIALGRHRGPRVAILKDAIVISAIAGETKAQPGSLMTWRSTDDGKTWKRASTINDVAEAAREGLHAMIARPDGSLFAVWLDLRAKGTRLIGSMSTDAGLTWSKNTLVYESPDGTICQCCHPSLSVDEKGGLWVMWRNALNGSRDFYVTSSTDGVHFTAARKLGTGTWKLDACPMDGGGFCL